MHTNKLNQNPHSSYSIYFSVGLIASTGKKLTFIRNFMSHYVHLSQHKLHCIWRYKVKWAQRAEYFLIELFSVKQVLLLLKTWHRHSKSHFSSDLCKCNVYLTLKVHWIFSSGRNTLLIPFHKCFLMSFRNVMSWHYGNTLRTCWTLRDTNYI